MPAIVHATIKKGCKKDTVRTYGFCNIKIIFVLLIKIITVHMQYLVVYIQETGF